LITESIKRELLSSLIQPLTIILDGITYTVRSRRQNQAIVFDSPQLVVFFSRDVPVEQFLGGKIGVYTDSEGNEIDVHGWREHTEVMFYAYARDDPQSGYMNGLVLVDAIADRVFDYILTHWDNDILFGNGLSLEEDIKTLQSPTYVSDFVGPEYSHLKTFSVKINSHRSFPTFESPSINTTVLQFVFRLQEADDTIVAPQFVVPTNEYNG